MSTKLMKENEKLETLEDARGLHIDNVDHNAAGKSAYNRTGAMDAETLEHQMTVLQAVKAYPAASWWAFVMSATIVSLARQS